MVAQPKPSAWEILQKYINTLNHMLIAMVSVYTTWLCWQLGPTAFSLHTWLCTIGYQLLMCESIMALYADNSWSALHTRKTQTHLHWILQALGSSLALAGMIQYFFDRQRHLISLHAQLGLASGVFTIIGVLNGTSALWARELFRWVKPVYTKLFHNVIGITAFATGMASLVYGFNKFPFRIVASPEVIIAIQTMSGLTIFFSLIGAAKSLRRLTEGAFPRLFARGGDDGDEDDSVTGLPYANGKTVA